MRVGIGYDSHRFTDARPLKLAGVRIPGVRGLEEPAFQPSLSIHNSETP